MTSTEVFLEKFTIGHAYFGGIGGDVAELVITRDAWGLLDGAEHLFVTMKKGPAAGQILSTAEELNRLPVGSVIRAGCGTASSVWLVEDATTNGTAKRYVGTGSSYFQSAPIISLHGVVEVLYVPEADASISTRRTN